jgi:hypothetical protein
MIREPLMVSEEGLLLSEIQALPKEKYSKVSET